jgi:hypothetical protein
VVGYLICLIAVGWAAVRLANPPSPVRSATDDGSSVRMKA